MQPPNWYADPADPSRERFWDGFAWTEHVRPATATPPPPPPAYGAQRPAPSPEPPQYWPASAQPAHRPTPPAVVRSTGVLAGMGPAIRACWPRLLGMFAATFLVSALLLVGAFFQALVDAFDSIGEPADDISGTGVALLVVAYLATVTLLPIGTFGSVAIVGAHLRGQHCSFGAAFKAGARALGGLVLAYLSLVIVTGLVALVAGELGAVGVLLVVVVAAVAVFLFTAVSAYLFAWSAHYED